MRRTIELGRRLAVLLTCGAAAAADAATGCDVEAAWVEPDTQRHFVVLAARRDVFYDGGGPAFVMLLGMDLEARVTDVGAVGIHADADGRPRFGAIPPPEYEPFLREADSGEDGVMLRLAISGPQYERVLGILRTWERRGREGALLYPEDLFMNNILLVKQATEALNRCTETVDLYALDWGLDDEISEHNPPSRVPLLYFAELRRRNGARHVADEAMPAEALSLADAARVASPAPLPEAPVDAAPAASSEAARHEHHHHHPP